MYSLSERWLRSIISFQRVSPLWVGSCCFIWGGGGVDWVEQILFSHWIYPVAWILIQSGGGGARTVPYSFSSVCRSVLKPCCQTSYTVDSKNRYSGSDAGYVLRMGLLHLLTFGQLTTSRGQQKAGQPCPSGDPVIGTLYVPPAGISSQPACVLKLTILILSSKGKGRAAHAPALYFGPTFHCCSGEEMDHSPYSRANSKERSLWRRLLVFCVSLVSSAQNCHWSSGCYLNLADPEFSH